MLEVVFGESEKGNVLFAKAIHGDSKDIVNIGFMLDIGDISGEIDGEERQKVYQQIFGKNHPDEKRKNYLFAEQRKDLTTLLKAARAGETIRIWKSNAPYSVCGFYYVCNLLKEINCPLNVVSLPEYLHKNNQTIISFSNWGEVLAEKVYDYLSFEQPVSAIEKKTASDHWENLVRENAPLRAVVNGKLISVPEDFYDFLILQNLPNKEFRIGNFIGELLMKYELNVTDRWYALRIDRMIDENQLIVIKNSADAYSRVLQKKDTKH